MWYTCEMFICCQFTLEKSGGGFFPLHRFESAHTAFLIIVRRFCLASSLRKNPSVRTSAMTTTEDNNDTTSRGYSLHKRRKNIAVYNKVSAFCAVSCYVSQSPYCLQVKMTIWVNTFKNNKRCHFQWQKNVLQLSFLLL